MTRSEFFSAVAKEVTGMRRRYVIRSMVIWSIAESGIEPCSSIDNTTPRLGAGNNPLNTTLKRPGATIFNSFGPNDEFHVYNYPTHASGIAAVSATLLQSNFANIVTTWKTSGSSVQEMLEQIGASPWGTSIEELMGSRNRYVNDREFYEALVVG